MGAEAELITKLVPALGSVIATIMLIIFTRTYLYKGMISAEMHEKQIQREIDLIAASQKVATEMCQITKELQELKRELPKTVSDKIGQLTERVRSLEFAMSDFLDQIRELNDQFEKHRKNIPDTGVFLAQRRREKSNDQPKADRNDPAN